MISFITLIRSSVKTAIFDLKGQKNCSKSDSKLMLIAFFSCSYLPGPCVMKIIQSCKWFGLLYSLNNKQCRELHVQQLSSYNYSTSIGQGIFQSILGMGQGVEKEAHQAKQKGQFLANRRMLQQSLPRELSRGNEGILLSCTTKNKKAILGQYHSNATIIMEENRVWGRKKTEKRTGRRLKQRARNGIQGNWRSKK